MAQLGTGASIAFGTSNFTMEATSIAASGASRPVLKTSHLGTVDDDTFIPGDLVDDGEIAVTYWFDPADGEPPIHAVPETITITFRSGATATFNGFISGYDWTNPLEELQEASLTIKVNGAITWDES